MKLSLIVLVLAIFFGGCTPQATLPQTQVPSPKEPTLTSAKLNSYSYDALLHVATLLQENKKDIDAFDGFISAMKVTVSNYSDMIKSSVYISNVVRYIPLPYAGEVSNTTKLISKTALNLNGAADALDRYKKSSAIFLETFAKLNPTNPNTADLVSLATFADTQLLRDAHDLEIASQKISSSTAMMAATTQAISDALDTTGDYLHSMKSFVGFSQNKETTSVSDKTKVTENKNSINAKITQLNQKIKVLENSAQNSHLYIEKARIYSDLSMKLTQGKL